MNFLTMEYFIAVAAKGNITKAAEELHITQQTLSAHIAALEEELDCQLIIRSKPLELTYAGSVFMDYAMNIYESYQSMWNEFNDLTFNQRGKLLLGVNYTRSYSIMPQIIEAFQSQYPNIEVRMTEGVNAFLHRSLINKDIDLAIARFPSYLPGVEICDFYNEEIVMCVPEKLMESVEMPAGDYVEELSVFRSCPFVLGSSYDIAGQVSRNMITKAGFMPIVKAQSNNVGTLLYLCIHNIGICFCPEIFVQTTLSREQLRHIRIFHLKTDKIEANYPIRFGYRKTSYQWKIILEFIRIAKEVEIKP